ncbi:hypothetical protein TUM17382_23040 [Shewanella algae]|nr:hypothetical protein TUM17382_23040 [Shewanella algae]
MKKWLIQLIETELTGECHHAVFHFIERLRQQHGVTLNGSYRLDVREAFAIDVYRRQVCSCFVNSQ